MTATKRVSVYGRSQIWKRRRDGIWQRYWVSTRFDFAGTGPELREAVAKTMREGWTPRRRFVRARATTFIRNPGRYAVPAVWRYYYAET